MAPWECCPPVPFLHPCGLQMPHIPDLASRAYVGHFWCMVNPHCMPETLSRVATVAVVHAVVAVGGEKSRTATAREVYREFGFVEIRGR